MVNNGEYHLGKWLFLVRFMLKLKEIYRSYFGGRNIE